jgi:hypothetical protein
MKEEFEDTKGVIIIRKSKKNNAMARRRIGFMVSNNISAISWL